MKKIVKTPGPGPDLYRLKGHCYDGTGLIECDFWEHNGSTGASRCTLFGGINGVHKLDSEALEVCDRIYGPYYVGPV